MARKPYVKPYTRGELLVPKQPTYLALPEDYPTISSANVIVDDMKVSGFAMPEGSVSLIEMSGLELELELDWIMEAAANALKHGGKLRVSAPCYPHSECFDNPNVKRVFTLQTLQHYAKHFRSMIIRPQGHYLSMEAIK